MGARAVLHPAGVEAVVSLELAPVGHRGALEPPASGFFAQVALAHAVAVGGVAVAVGTVVVFFFENAEVSFRGGGARGADGDRGDQQGLGAFHDIGHLVAGGDFDADA